MDFNLWIEALTKPKEVFAAQKSKADMMAGVMNYGIAYLIVGVIMAIFMLAIPVAAITTLIMVLVGGIIGSFIGVGVLYLIAMLLGGKGTFTQQYYLMSIMAVPMIILGIIPIVNFLAGLYAIYLVTLLLMEVHAFDTMKAVLVWLIPAIIVLVFWLVMAATFAAMFGGMYGFKPTLGP
jgi:hypothetical protein